MNKHFPLPPRMSSSLKWSLLDDFGDTRAAGAVNGTAPTPGPGNRVVIDTENRMTIAGDRLAFASGKATAAFGDPALWWNAIIRKIGKVIVFKYRQPNTTYGAQARVGFATAQSGTPDQNAFGINGAQPISRDNAGGGPVNSILVVDTEYLIAIVLRTAGAFYFVKGGTFTNWTMVWNSIVGSTSPVYPFAASFNTTVLIDYAKSPINLFPIAQLAADSFGRANGALGVTSGSVYGESGGSGIAWVDKVGTFAIVSFHVVCSALAGGLGISTVETGNINHCVEVVLGARTSGNSGMVFRYVDTQNYLVAYHDGTNAKVDKVVGGAVTNIITGAIAFFGGIRLFATADGNKVRLVCNTTLIGAETTLTDSILLSGTQVGMYSTDIANTLDNFIAWARGSGGEYTGLSRYATFPVNITLPTQLAYHPGTLLEGFETIGDWTVAGGSAAANTTEFWQGTASVKVTTNSGAVCTIVKTVSLALNNLYAGVHLFFYVHGTIIPHTVTLEFSSTSDFSKRFATETASQGVLHLGWNCLNINNSEWLAAVGGEVWTNTMIRMRVTITPNASEVAVVSVDNLIGGAFTQGACFINFDDGRATVYSQAYAYMKTYGMRGTSFVPSALIASDANYMTWAQMQEIRNAGWTVGNHSQTHVNLTTLTQNQAQAELQACYDDLIAHGITSGKHVAYPFFGVNDTVIAAMTAFGGITGRVNYTPNANILPFVNIYKIPTNTIDSTVTLAAAKLVVDRARTYGEFVGLLFHNLVVSSPGATEWTISDFQALMDYIHTSGLPVITMEDLNNLNTSAVVIPVT